MQFIRYILVDMKTTRQILIKLSIVLLGMVFASCGGSNSGSTISQKKVRSGLDKYNNGYDLEKGEHGMMRSKSTKKSHLNNLRASVAGGTVNKTDYSKASYRKKRWGGESSYDKKSFNNTGAYNAAAYKASKNNSFDKGYSAGASNFQGQNYATNNNTQERNAGYVRKGSSGYVTSRKNATKQPVIFDRDDYNQLKVSESNSLLGR